MVWNALVLALRALRRNLMRSTLTMLGIVIGIAAVITMVNLGAGATAQVTAQIASLGSNLLTVLPGQMVGPGQAATPQISIPSLRCSVRLVWKRCRWETSWPLGVGRSASAPR
jgi:hypothetical protein